MDICLIIPMESDPPGNDMTARYAAVATVDQYGFRGMMGGLIHSELI